jgi:hypothetical protein
MVLRVVQNMQGAFKFLQNIEGKGPANDIVDKNTGAFRIL